MSVPKSSLNLTPSETQNRQQNVGSGEMPRGQEVRIVNRTRNDPVAIMSFLVDKSLHRVRLRVQFQPNPSGELPRKETIWIMRVQEEVMPRPHLDWATQRPFLETSCTPLVEDDLITPESRDLQLTLNFMKNLLQMLDPEAVAERKRTLPFIDPKLLQRFLSAKDPCSNSGDKPTFVFLGVPVIRPASQGEQYSNFAEDVTDQVDKTG